MIARTLAAVPPITPRANDGVVNTERQVDGEFVGLVLDDHGDVIGQYSRRDLLDGKQVDTGPRTSGAEFGDEEFFALIALAADGIARSIHGD